MTRVNRQKNWTYANWPEPWHSAWNEANRVGDAFRPGGPATKLAVRTVKGNEMAFGRYYEFITNNGIQNDNSCISLDNLRMFADRLKPTIAPYSVLAQLSQVVAAVRLMKPNADLRDANSAIVRFANGVRPVRISNQTVLSPIELISLGASLAAEAEESPVRDKTAALLYRNGVLIVAGALCPLRHRNWRMMRKHPARAAGVA